MTEHLVFRKIGFTQKPHGLQGELKVAIDALFEEDFLQAKVIYLKVKGQNMPYFIQQIRGEHFLIVKLEDVNTREDALAIAGKEIWLDENDILSDSERTIAQDISDYQKLIGYEIFDLTLGPIGKIESIVEMPQQEMVVVVYLGKEKLIPLHPHLIQDIDESGKTIRMDLPEGLLDL